MIDRQIGVDRYPHNSQRERKGGERHRDIEPRRDSIYMI